MDMEKIDYSDLRERAMKTDIIVVEMLALIFLVAVFSGIIWLVGTTFVGVALLWAIYHYKIKISRYLDFLDEDIPDPEI